MSIVQMSAGVPLKNAIRLPSWDRLKAPGSTLTPTGVVVVPERSTHTRGAGVSGAGRTPAAIKIPSLDASNAVVSMFSL
jgi:hypothetical protein